MHKHPFYDLEYLKKHSRKKYRQIEHSPMFQGFAKEVHEARQSHERRKHGRSHRR